MSSAADPRIFRVNPSAVTVTVRGEAVVVEALKDIDIRAVVDLRDIESAHDLRKKIELLTPGGVAWSRPDPDEVQITTLPANVH